MKFNRLTIIKEIEPKVYKSGCHRRVICKCECGCVKEYFLSEVLNNRTKSCGCYNKEHKSKYKHKKDDNIHLYAVWGAMLRRCGIRGKKSNSNDKKMYEERGITVCSEWMNFDCFVEWSNISVYKRGLQIDRINNDGNYEPSNCRWVTSKENNRNRSNNIFYKGKLLLEFFEENNIHNLRWGTFYMRIRKLKWSVDKAISTPLKTHR